MVNQRNIETEGKKVIDTLPKLVYRDYDQWADDAAIRIKRFGRWKKYDWRKYYETVKHFSLGLVSLGLGRDDVVCIVGDNDPEWFWSEFAVQAAGGIVTAAPVDATPSEVKHIASHSGAKFAVVKDLKQINQFLEIKTDLPALKKLVCWDTNGLKNNDNPLLISFNEVMNLGKEYEKAHLNLFEQNVFKGAGDDIAFIYYSQGKAGLPEGVRMSHRALIDAAKGFISRNPIKPDDNLLSGFPASGIVDSCFAAIPHLLTGAVLNFPEKPETLARDIRRIKPDFVIYEPRHWESLAGEIQTRIIGANPVKRFFYNLFLPVGHKFTDYKFRNKKPDILWRLLYIPAYFLLFRPLKNRFGLVKVRFAATIVPGLSADTIRLIHDIGVELRLIYVSEEAGYIASQGKGEIDIESVGRPALNTEVRITATGELLVRGDLMFSGYQNNAQKTADVLAEGWYHTGVAANINEKGRLVITGRIK